jgi:uncharacterized lipoprotein
MSMNVMRGVSLLSLVLLLSACSYLENHAAYEKSAERPPLAVPEGLSKPAVDPSLNVPPASSGKILSEGETAPPDSPVQVDKAEDNPEKQSSML